MKKQKSQVIQVSIIEYEGMNKANVLGCREYPISRNKIPKDLVDNFIENIEFETVELYGKPTTLMTYKLKNGFIGSDSTTSVDPSNYSLEIGSDILRKRLEEKVYFGLGFALGMGQGK